MDDISLEWLVVEDDLATDLATKEGLVSLASQMRLKLKFIDTSWPALGWLLNP